MEYTLANMSLRSNKFVFFEISDFIVTKKIAKIVILLQNLFNIKKSHIILIESK